MNLDTNVCEKEARNKSFCDNRDLYFDRRIQGCADWVDCQSESSNKELDVETNTCELSPKYVCTVAKRFYDATTRVCSDFKTCKDGFSLDRINNICTDATQELITVDSCKKVGKWFNSVAKQCDVLADCSG